VPLPLFRSSVIGKTQNPESERVSFFRNPDGFAVLMNLETRGALF
jgi:hypothetical protein